MKNATAVRWAFDFRILIEALPDSVIVADSAGAICAVNSQTEALFGYTRDELQDQPVEVLVPTRLRSCSAPISVFS
jgi:PAS domain S-box-containing protein